MKFLVDNQLPAALARFLNARGVTCSHVLDLGLASASDSKIWRHVTETNGVLITKDEDFLYLAQRSQGGARLIWLRSGNCRTKDLLSAMDSAWSKIEASLESGERIIELR